jgi:hypothetical protein
VGRQTSSGKDGYGQDVPVGCLVLRNALVPLMC